jgi:Flp pilus assembly protein TadG
MFGNSTTRSLRSAVDNAVLNRGAMFLRNKDCKPAGARVMPRCGNRFSSWLYNAAESAASLRRNQRGVAAIEFAMFGLFLSVGMLNVADIGIYLYERMEVENATEMGAQAAWKTCPLSQLPATVNCSGLNAAVTTAVQSTSLGTQVSLQSGSPSEGYYCVNSSNALEYMSSVSSRPADCTAAGEPSLQPGDYIVIQTTFSYAPLFPSITVASKFTTPITRTAMMRLG